MDIFRDSTHMFDATKSTSGEESHKQEQFEVTVEVHVDGGDYVPIPPPQPPVPPLILSSSDYLTSVFIRNISL